MVQKLLNKLGFLRILKGLIINNFIDKESEIQIQYEPPLRLIHKLSRAPF